MRQHKTLCIVGRVRRILVAWIGRTDLRAPTESEAIGLGPIAQAVDARELDELWLLLADYPKSDVASYLKWLRGRSSTRLEVLPEKLSGPTQFGEIYEAAIRGVNKALGGRSCETQPTFHLSPGTPAMAAVWILLGKTRFPVSTSKQRRWRLASQRGSPSSFVDGSSAPAARICTIATS